MKDDGSSRNVLLKVMVLNVFIFAAFGWSLIFCYENRRSVVDVLLRRYWDLVQNRLENMLDSLSALRAFCC